MINKLLPMKKQHVAGLMVLFAFMWAGCQPQRDYSDGFSSIEPYFADPPSAYRCMPLWVWNGKVTESELDRMLGELKEAGFGGLFVHPRPGMITEYLSDDWFRLYEYTVRKGKEMDMEVWIYDENSYPSGFAGGHVPQEMPESFNQGQGLQLEKKESIPDNTDDYFICLIKNGESWKDITTSVNDYKGVQGEYYLYKKTYYRKSDWHGGYSYVDLLVPGVTEKFIELTMTGYEKTLKHEFGKAIPGIFTDEPNIVTSGGFRWTPDLFEVFQKQWGYDLKPLIPLLSEESGAWKKVRHNYMETLLQLFIDRWAKPWFAYTEENNLQWTGHYWEHGWPQMNDGPDNMAMYAWHQTPAIDMLFNQFNEISPTAQFGNVRSVKELRSVANQMGYARTLSETYGGGGWETTFKDFKRLGDWEYVLGVNFMNQHLAHQTLTGARKYDYPPVFTNHSPWYNSYRVMNDYFGRLSLVMSKGFQQNDILVLEPNATLWSYYSHTRSNPALMRIGRNFQEFVTTLEKNQVEYDLGSENIIKDQGHVAKGKFIIGKAAYSTVVVPPMNETFNRPTFDLLRQFVEQGGRLICFSEPYLIDGDPNDALTAFMKNEPIIRVPELDKSVIEKYFTFKDCKISCNGGNLFHHRRRYADGELIFIVNSSMEEVSTGNLVVKGKNLLVMDAMSGEIHTYPAKKENGLLAADFRLEPAGSLVLFSSFKSAKKYSGKTEVKAEKTVAATGETMVTRMRENAMTLDFCDVTVNGQTYKNIHFSRAADIAYREHGFTNGNPWNTSVQYKRNILDRDTYTDGGFTAKYYFTVNDDFYFSGMQLVTERPELFTVKVNGLTVKPIPGKWWLDKTFGVYAIGSSVRKGVNTVELDISPMSIFAEIEPVYILGDFAVVPEEKGWSISAPVSTFTIGSWKEQKQPFYSYDFKYSRSYDIPEVAGVYFVALGKWTGTVAEVYVNGVKAGIIGFDPYRLDVTSFLKTGKNQIDVHVVGSHKNLLGPHYKNPAPGLASPGHWKNINEQIPGTAYQMIDYGLMEAFELITNYEVQSTK